MIRPLKELALAVGCRAFAYVILPAAYGLAWLAAVIGRAVPRSSWKPTGRLAVTGTFHNPNWYLSHVMPLVRSAPGGVILVADQPQLPLENVRFACPPRWLSRLLGRAGAKALWLMGVGLRHRPDLYMGYHVLPGACSALVAGKLLGRPTCYQMTGGPVEIVGGGIYKDGFLASHLGRPPAMLERIVMAVVRQFDLVVVRGRKTRRFLRRRNMNGRVAIITGSVRPGSPVRQDGRDIDVIYAGRLARVKQLEQFLEVIAAVRRRRPDVRAAIVGDGPELHDLRRRAGELGLADCVDFVGKRTDVEEFLGRAKVFLLTSRSEGQPIAVIEAMAAAAVPVAYEVGELGDLVTDGACGYLERLNDTEAITRRVLSLLANEQLRLRLSQAAAEVAWSRCSLELVTERWRQCLGDVIGQSD